MSGNKPTAEVRLGRIKASIWANRSQDGGRWHTVRLTRLYQDGEEWRSTHSFGRNDLLTVAKVADLAHTKVCELEAAVRSAEGEAAPADRAEAGTATDAVDVEQAATRVSGLKGGDAQVPAEGDVRVAAEGEDWI